MFISCVHVCHAYYVIINQMPMYEANLCVIACD